MLDSPRAIVTTADKAHFNFIEGRVIAQVDFDDVTLVCIEFSHLRRWPLINYHPFHRRGFVIHLAR